MKRITYKLLKTWIAESEFAQEHNITVGAWNGFYHIMKNNENLVSEENPKKCWEMYQLYVRGYYLRVEEEKYRKEVE